MRQRFSHAKVTNSSRGSPRAVGPPALDSTPADSTGGNCSNLGVGGGKGNVSPPIRDGIISSVLDVFCALLRRAPAMVQISGVALSAALVFAVVLGTKLAQSRRTSQVQSITPPITFARESERFQRPMEPIGEEPGEILDFEDEVRALKVKLEAALRRCGAPWVQNGTLAEETAIKDPIPRWDGTHAIRSFDEMQFEDGVYGEQADNYFIQSRDSKDWMVDVYADPYYATDDDSYRVSGVESYQWGCRRTSTHRLHHPTCNHFHQNDLLTDLMQESSNFLGSGAYRDTFMIQSQLPSFQLDEPDSAVIKSISLYYNMGDDLKTLLEFQRLDALVMEQLHASPMVSDIYGHCALGILAEYCPIRMESVIVSTEIEQKPDLEGDLRTLNSLTGSEKLQLALDFAKPLAVMHGFRGGVIAHVDVKPDQYMRGYDGVVKLIDFNRAEILLFDERRRVFCPQREGKVYTVYRSPEELDDRPINDMADVYNYASNIVYSIMTGLWIHSIAPNPDDVKEHLLSRSHPFYDQRWESNSYADATLVQVLKSCWEFDPEDRPSIFDIIDYLEHAISNNAELEARGAEQVEWREYL